MHLEKDHDAETNTTVDRLVVDSQWEEFDAEHLFMIGAGVNCGQVARDYSDPLQGRGAEYPIPLSAKATETVLKGLHKIMNGPPAGFHGTKPRYARSLLAQLLPERETVLPLAMVETELETAYEEALEAYPEVHPATLN